MSFAPPQTVADDTLPVKRAMFLLTPPIRWHSSTPVIWVPFMSLSTRGVPRQSLGRLEPERRNDRILATYVLNAHGLEPAI